MSIWSTIGAFVSRISGDALSSLVELVRTTFEGDPDTRRRVAFSVAMIALSAKMAKADGIVSESEVLAFREIFDIPEEEAHNVARLYNLARQDIAGFEAYAGRLANLCGADGPNCDVLEDILDGLFHIAKADGVIHEAELAYLERIAEIFAITPNHFESIRSRHVADGADPLAVLGLDRQAKEDEVRRRYRELVKENHPDRLIGRGVPKEFIAIATTRLAAINAAYETYQRSLARA